MTLVVATQWDTFVKTHQTVNFEWVQFTIYKLYYNKVDLKKEDVAVPLRAWGGYEVGTVEVVVGL